MAVGLGDGCRVGGWLYLNGKKTSLDRKKLVAKNPNRMLLAVNFLVYRQHLPIWVGVLGC